MADPFFVSIAGSVATHSCAYTPQYLTRITCCASSTITDIEQVQPTHHTLLHLMPQHNSLQQRNPNFLLEWHQVSTRQKWRQQVAFECTPIVTIFFTRDRNRPYHDKLKAVELIDIVSCISLNIGVCIEPLQKYLRITNTVTSTWTLVEILLCVVAILILSHSAYP